LRMSVGGFLLRRLAELGVRHLFGVPGDYNLCFLEQVERSDQVEFVGCCNELNAAYARTAPHGSPVCQLWSRHMAWANWVPSPAWPGSTRSGFRSYASPVPRPYRPSREHALLNRTLADGSFGNMLTCHREITVAQARIVPDNARSEIDRVLRSCWIPQDVASER
jgi:indolepyruvate decarboxylase